MAVYQNTFQNQTGDLIIDRVTSGGLQLYAC